jgi:hypothetical protein
LEGEHGEEIQEGKARRLGAQKEGHEEAEAGKEEKETVTEASARAHRASA